MHKVADKTRAWFSAKGWQIAEFQSTAWQAWHQGESGLIHSSTGSGKTLAAWLGPVQAACEQTDAVEGLQILWVTPLRALAADTLENLSAACDAHDLNVDVQIRTGDTSSSVRLKQREKPPYALITTPESLSLLLSYPEANKTFKHLHTIVVDEWHELLGTKRGVQLELCLARLRKRQSRLRIWGLSATLGNLNVAMQCLLGPNCQGTLIEGEQSRHIDINTLIPDDLAQFPWSGHLGLNLVHRVIDHIESANTTLLFTNTRSQAEMWFQGLLEARPDWLMTMALHHGSIDKSLRIDIENRLRQGELSCVVCTSSLDLGVDFSPVDQVVQIGSPKGVARLLQRAGRSGHRPGVSSRILCVPAHAFELVEFAATRKALAQGNIEDRQPLTLSLDVLCQHLVTIALGSGFIEEEMHDEIQDTHAFSALNDEQWHWVIDFITRGGQALQGYPQYHKVVNITGTHRVMNEQIAKKHRMAIGTINSDSTMFVSYKGGKRLGSIEESFIAKLKPGDVFQFSGKRLELVMSRDMTAYVKNTSKRTRWIPRWNGAHLPLSTKLADMVLETLNDWQQQTTSATSAVVNKSATDTSKRSTTKPTADSSAEELLVIDSLLRAQSQWSDLPLPDHFLVETTITEEGFHLFCFPFAGRLAHEGLALLVAYRLTRDFEVTITLTMNDYGFELNSPESFDVSEALLRQWLRPDALVDDILAAINASEITKRRFRDIARIAGLIFEGYPGRSKSSRQVQASSSLIYEVLENHDAENLLLDQAKQEVLQAQLEYQRIEHCLQSLQSKLWQINHTDRLTPMSFPLWAESLQSQTHTVSTEPFQQRVERMLRKLENAMVETR